MRKLGGIGEGPSTTNEVPTPTIRIGHATQGLHIGIHTQCDKHATRQSTINRVSQNAYRG